MVARQALGFLCCAQHFSDLFASHCDSYLPLSLFISMALLPSALSLKHRWSATEILFSLLIAWSVISLIWAPDPLVGIRDVTWSLPFLGSLLAASIVASQDQRRIAHVLGLFVSFSGIQSILVIAFRLSPSLEEAFLSFPAVSIFMNTNLISGMFIKPEQTSGPGKIWGPHDQCQWSWCLGKFGAVHKPSLLPDREPQWRFLAFGHALAVIACGSKYALMLTCPLPPWLPARSLRGRPTP